MYTVASFFAGIGGFDLAFEAAGFDIILQVEIDDFCQRILTKHWPDVPKIADIKSANAQTVPYADVFVGGFPCQDISLAGNRAGIRDGTRSGLWFELARIIGTVRPRVVLLENVAAITTAGGGGVRVIADLAEMGYDARWGIIRASDAGAPHQRARWWCVAYRSEIRRNTWGTKQPLSRVGEHGTAWNMAHAPTQGLQATDRTGQPAHTAQAGGGVEHGPVRRGDVGYTIRPRLEGWQGVSEDNGTQQPTVKRTGKRLDNSPRGQRYDVRRKRAQANATRDGTRNGARQAQPRVGRGADGLPYRLDRPRWPAPPGPQHDWEPPRVTDRTDHRASRLKALGNAVVPAVVYPLAVAIREWLERADSGELDDMSGSVQRAA